MANLTYREHQLLQAFRSTDERGRRAIEAVARFQVEAIGQARFNLIPRRNKVVPLPAVNNNVVKLHF